MIYISLNILNLVPMNLFRKITLSFRYGSGYLIVAGIASMCFAFIVGAHSGDPEGMSEGLFLCKIFKLLTIPIILYVFRKFDRSGALYFWLNLGISRTEYYVIPIVIEYLFFRILIYLAPPLFTLLHLN
jgi:hypothetical protein